MIGALKIILELLETGQRFRPFVHEERRWSPWWGNGCRPGSAMGAAQRGLSLCIPGQHKSWSPGLAIRFEGHGAREHDHR